MSDQPRPAAGAGNGDPLTRGIRWTMLLTRARRGDRGAFEALMGEAEPSIWLFAYQVVGDASLADDVLAETFEKVWLNLPGYHEGLSNARTWIYLIAHRVALDYRDRRTRQRRTEVARFEALFRGPGAEGDGAGLEPEDRAELPPPAGADRPFRQALVEEALRKLDPGDREILLLCHVEDRSYEEIAGLLGCSVKAVGPRLTRARGRFRQALHPDAQG
jgi:RNA polymerase sigma-70 factor (ECF subfamily)